MSICVNSFTKICKTMRSISKQDLLDRLQFIDQQIQFILDSTESVRTIDDFLLSMSGMVLFNSTSMCLQTIGEAIRQVDDQTQGSLFSCYPSTPWKRIIGLRNIISHEYLSIDPLLILDIVQNELIPLQTSLKQVIHDYQSDC